MITKEEVKVFTVWDERAEAENGRWSQYVTPLQTWQTAKYETYLNVQTQKYINEGL